MTEEHTAGRGALARIIASRGGRAAPEAPFVIEHREALIYMLCEAAELEHAIMCQYLFAAFSLKQSTDEGRKRTAPRCSRGVAKNHLPDCYPGNAAPWFGAEPPVGGRSGSSP